MDVPDSNCVLEGGSDAERLKAIRALWLADLPVKTAFLMIGHAAFDGMQKSGE
jgi:hypothetical protein